MSNSKFLMVIQLIFTILTIASFAQAQFCNDQPKINGKLEQDELDKLPERMTAYFNAYKTGDIKQIVSFINRSDSESNLEVLQPWFNLQKKKGAISDIENICVDSINFYENVTFAQAKGKVEYSQKSKKKKREMNLRITKDNGQIYFSRIMFKGIDYIEFIVKKKN